MCCCSQRADLSTERRDDSRCERSPNPLSLSLYLCSLYAYKYYLTERCMHCMRVSIWRCEDVSFVWNFLCFMYKQLIRSYFVYVCKRCLASSFSLSFFLFFFFFFPAFFLSFFFFFFFFFLSFFSFFSSSFSFSSSSLARTRR